MISVSQANSKTAEFSRLFDVFDRVATRRARELAGEANSTSQLITADDVENVPAEFAPVLKNLSTVLSLRALRDEAHTHWRARVVSTGTCVRRDIDVCTFTDASVVTHILAEHSAPNDGDDEANLLGDGVEEEEEVEAPSFPLDEHYPFTFKLMLHKLYDLDEWGDKIKHVVETSKSQYRPLAERDQNLVGGATTNIKEGEEKRSHRPAAKYKYKSSGVTKPVKVKTSRVLKKRYVGRRKSGPVSTGVWVYDATISVTEAVGPRSAAETARLVIRGAGNDMAESRLRHRSLTAFGETQSRDVARCKVDNPVSLVDSERETPIPTLPSSPVSAATSAQQIIERKGKNVVRKRSSLASIFASASESCKISTMKRPLCV